MELEKLKQRAKNNAYALLRQRPRSEHEIRSRLKRKGYSEALIEEIVADLKRIGDIDDARFASFWVESRMRTNPMGDIGLKHELKEKGISESLVEAVLSDKKTKYDEYETALGMAKEQFERLKKLDRRKASKRVYDFLLRRGFSYDVIRRVVDGLINEN